MHNYLVIAVSTFILSACSTMSTSSSSSSSSSSTTTINKTKLELNQKQETKKSNLNLIVYKKVLSNGLKLIVYEDHRLPIFSYYQFYDVGGRFEGAGTTGATHFLEHMMFKGSKKFGPRSYDRIIEGAGGSNNAYTTFDSTVYHEVAPVSILDTVLQMEADRMQNLTIENKSFEKERNVIFSERKMRYENSPRGTLYLGAMKTIYAGTPYGGSVIGDVLDLKNLKREDLVTFYKNFYTPDNTIISIAGDVNHEILFKKIEEYFGAMKSSSQLIRNYKKKKDDPTHYKFKKNLPRNVHFYSTNQNPLFMLVYKGYKLGDKEAYILDLLSMMAGDGESSYFYKNLVLVKKPLFSKISVSNSNKIKSGIFFFNGELMPKVSLKSAKKKLLSTISLFCKKGIDDRAVQKIKNQILVTYYNSISSNRGVASFLGYEEYYFDDYNHYKKELEIYNSIKTIDVKNICKNFLLKEVPVYISVWNKNSKRLK